MQLEPDDDNAEFPESYKASPNYEKSKDHNQSEKMTSSRKKKKKLEALIDDGKEMSKGIRYQQKILIRKVGNPP